MKISDFLKEYRRFSKTFLPRTVFMFLIFLLIAFFSSSVFMGAGLSLFSMFALKSGTVFLATLFLFCIELAFLFCIFILQYGFFLSALRFARGQPVAITFLFAGFKQKRAKKFAAFFAAVFVILFFLIMAGVSSEAAFFMQDAKNTQEIAEAFFKSELYSKIAVRSLVFFAAVFFAYFPFAFAWPHVYDEVQKNFWQVFFQSLKFFFKRFLKFLSFEFFCQIKIFALILTFDFARFFLSFKIKENAFLLFLNSLFGTAAFFLGAIFVSSITLSINFFYEKTRENSLNENFTQKNSQNENSALVFALEDPANSNSKTQNENSQNENSN